MRKLDKPKADRPVDTGGGYRPLGDGTILLDLLFMSYPEVRVGLKRLGLTSPHID